MPELTVIVPSRGRPEAATTLARAFGDTCTAATTLLFAVDDNDPRGREYEAATRVLPFGHTVAVNVIHCPSTNMVQALNIASVNACVPESWAPEPANFPAPFAVGFMGDDHCPRTYGWDAKYLEALHDLGTGLVYGDDLLQRQNLPTQVAMTSDIVRALGYMAPAGLTHLYVDNFWRDLGNAAGCLRYLPDVIIEHRHPFVGKAAMDDGYERVNTPEMYGKDAQAYETFIGSGELHAAVEAVRTLRADHG